MTDNRTAQAARAQAGTNLESVVARILNSLLNDQNIFVIKGSLKDLRRVLQNDALTTAAARMANPCFDNPQIPHHTQYCESVCPLDELYFDALRWRDEAFPV